MIIEFSLNAVRYDPKLIIYFLKLNKRLRLSLITIVQVTMYFMSRILNNYAIN